MLTICITHSYFLKTATSPENVNLAGTATSHEVQQHCHSGGKLAVITGTLRGPLGQGCSSPAWDS